MRRLRGRELAEEYYHRGLVHLEEGNYLLALAEFEEAVRLVPDNWEAQEQLGLLQALLGDENPLSSDVSPEAMLSLYGEASTLYSQGKWPEAMMTLERLRRLDPEYRVLEVEEMLFDVYQRQGMDLVEAGELEDALVLLDRALELEPDDPDVAELRYWISLYLDGLSHWGVDWEGSAATFRELYGLNQSFLDVEHRLHDALLSVGDLYYEEGAWCVAESQYAEAVSVMVSETASSKRDEARDLCVRAITEAPATETPLEEPVEVVTATVTAPAPLPEGSFVGEFLGYAETDVTEMRIRVCVVNSAGEGVPGAGVEIAAYGWRSDPQMTEIDGCCDFAGLTQELEFTVGLTDLPCDPARAVTRWGTEARVDFSER
jgi:tetratricopeptide (TPR) repeat protein